MPKVVDKNNEIKKRLKKLQEQKESLISWIQTGVSQDMKNIYDRRIIQIKKEMANLNRLDDDEKNIHVIWIGVPPKGEFDNLKLWAKYNPEYKIHLWTDSTHLLTYDLNKIIFENSEIIKDGQRQHDYEKEAMLKEEFYYKYQLKNPEKTFDENAQQFLIDKGCAIEVNFKAGKAKMIQEQEDIKKYTDSEVVLHDVNQEKDNIFPNSAYYDGYLKTLEHLHICAGASDRLRYALLDRFGGVYLDTDLTPKFNLEKLKSEKKIDKLIKLIKWDEEYGINWSKPELILNQIILLDNLNQLNDENLSVFAKKWQEIFAVDKDENFKNFKKIAKYFKRSKLNLVPNMKLLEFPIDNYLQTVAYDKNGSEISNAFFVSKKDSKFLQEVMQRIEVTDGVIKDMSMYKKLINKNNMIMFHTGPTNIYCTIMENDSDNFYQNGNNGFKIASLNTINSCDSSWFKFINHKETITNQKQLKALFLGKIEKVSKCDDYNIEKQLENLTLSKKVKDKELDIVSQIKTTNSNFQNKKNEFDFEWEF